MLSVWFHLHSLCWISDTVKVRSGLQSNLEPGGCSPEEAALQAGTALAPGRCPAQWPHMPVEELSVPRAPALPTPDTDSASSVAKVLFNFLLCIFVKLTRPSPKKLKLSFIIAQCGYCE